MSLFDDFENFTEFAPRDIHRNALEPMFTQLLAWGGALKQLRSEDKRKPAMAA